jgi:spore germination protein
MNKFLTNRQISFMLYCAIVGHSVINLPKTVAESAGTGGWISLLILTILFIGITYIITDLQYIYEDKTLYEYSEQLVGKLITYLFIILFIIYYFITFAMIIRIQAETTRLVILTKTPVVYICILFYIVVFYALTKGINVIARVCEIYGLLNMLGFIFINSLVATKGSLVNIRPLFVMSDLITYLKAAAKLTLPFLGMEIFLFLPINRTNNRNIFKYTGLTVGFIGILYIYIAECSISVVGVETAINLEAASFAVVRGIDIQSLEFLRRLDGIYIIFWTMNVVCASCLWGYGTIVFTGKIIKNVKHSYMVIAIVILSFIISQMPKTKSQVESSLKYSSYLGLVATIVIPVILFIITKVKKYDKQI